MPGHVAEAGLPYDPARARQLLAEAGYGKHKHLPAIPLIAYWTRQAAAEYLQTQWHEHLGVAISLKILRVPSLLEEARRSHPHIFLGSWIADYADPDNFLRVDVHLDARAWRNAAYELLLERAGQTTDQTERLSLYQEADRLLMEEAVLVPLLYTRHHILLKPWIKNFTIPAIKNPGFWKDIVIEPH